MKINKNIILLLIEESFKIPQLPGPLRILNTDSNMTRDIALLDKNDRDKILSKEYQENLKKDEIKNGIKRGLVIGGLVGGASMLSDQDTENSLEKGLMRGAAVGGVVTGGSLLLNEINKNKIKNLDKKELEAYHKELKKHYGSNFDLVKNRAKLSNFSHLLSKDDDSFPRFKK